MFFDPVDHRSEPRSAGLAALAQTIEELSVAEDELRAQNIELERTRDALEAERARYRELFHHAPVPYLVTDAAGTVREVNRPAALLLGMRADHVVGKPMTVFTRGISRARLRTLTSNCIEARESVSGAFSITPRSGRSVRVEATGAAIRDAGGRVIEMRWLLLDRTQRALKERTRRRRAAELERVVAERTAELAHAHEVKDQLLTTVSHELRTVLSAIGGYADLLEMGVRGQLTEPQLADVRRIQRAYVHLDKIVNDLLSYGRAVSGGLSLESSDFGVAESVAVALDLIDSEARRKSIALEVAGVENGASKLFVRADVDRVRQVLVNLIGNAIKFTPEGGRITVGWRAADGMGRIEIIDTGPGIPSGSEERIFQPFVRLERQEQAPGTGLGLAISRQLVRAMRGDLVVRRADTGGACFVLTLPLSTDLAPARRASRAGGDGV